MIELKQDRLNYSFADVHEDAVMSLSLQRTLRIPDDGDLYHLPPGLGCFPMRHVDDFAEMLPESWREHGGVMMPMYQSEAMWISFNSPAGYPFLVKVATGKINAVTGEDWAEGINRDPQDYMVVPTQPWLDGYCVEKGEIRQFVAMPLGKGYTAEEQIKGEATHGGLQIVAYPMKAKEWAKIRKQQVRLRRNISHYVSCELLQESAPMFEMGLAPGGRMKQEIYDDPYDMDVWDMRHSSRCFIHIANSIAWRAITGSAPPTMPPTAKQYDEHGLPWFDYYDETASTLEGSKTLKDLKSVVEMSEEKGEMAIPENESTTSGNIIEIRKKKTGNQVRESTF